jgi:hypothetical protein
MFVQIVTYNSSNCVAAGKLLVDKFPTIFWTPRVAHRMDFMLENIGKLEQVKFIMNNIKSIKKYIYNNTWVLNITREYTENNELVPSPCHTKFATNFLFAGSICAQKLQLQKM